MSQILNKAIALSLVVAVVLTVGLVVVPATYAGEDLKKAEIERISLEVFQNVSGKTLPDGQTIPDIPIIGTNITTEGNLRVYIPNYYLGEQDIDLMLAGLALGFKESLVRLPNTGIERCFIYIFDKDGYVVGSFTFSKRVVEEGSIGDAVEFARRSFTSY